MRENGRGRSESREQSECRCWQRGRTKNDLGIHKSCEGAAIQREKIEGVLGAET
jgi:hypothetical protein